jgi:hypothetical protein
VVEKIAFKRKSKHLYQPKADVVVEVDVPPLDFLMVDGAGDPAAQGLRGCRRSSVRTVVYAEVHAEEEHCCNRLRRHAARRALVGRRHEPILSRRQVELEMDHDDHAAGPRDARERRRRIGEVSS